MRVLPTVVVAVSVVLLAMVPAGASGDGSPFEPPRDEWYAENDTGHWGDGTRVRIDEECLDLTDEEDRVACSLEAFQQRPFVVIAFVDTGINPYHHDFRAPEFIHHPSEFIEGYPDDAGRLDVSLDLADTEGYDAARQADAAAYNAPVGSLRWIPGTRIIGAYRASTGGTPILDTNGHGTGVASSGAGQFYGSNPNALIVTVDNLGGQGLVWATQQPWIDIVSNSYGVLAHLPLGEHRSTLAATERGQTVVFSAGNGMTNTNSYTIFDLLPVDDPCSCKTPDSNPAVTSPYGTGPSWTLKVGAASPVNGQAYWWHSIPPDISSFGAKWAAASTTGVEPDDRRDFGGTSNAAPLTAGVLSAIIERAREILGDTTGGQRPGQVVAEAAPGVEPPESGPLADGVLTRLEAEEILKKTAFPVPFDPDEYLWDYAIRPTTEAYFTYMGYGLVDRDSKARALAVLEGAEDLPDRTEVDLWMEAVDAARDVFWHNWP
jgi:hypothetical protein